MEVSQIIFFDSKIYENILLGIIFFILAIVITFFLIKNNFVRIVLFYGYSCYLLPIYIIKNWQIDHYDHLKYLEFVTVFFVTVIFFYLLSNTIFKKNNKIKLFNKIILVEKKKSLRLFQKIIFQLFYPLTFFLLLYFLILKKSPFLIWLISGSSDLLRYEIYNSNYIIQLIYVMYCRFFSVFVILLTPPPFKKIFPIFLFIELIAIQSLERQSVFIVMAAVFVRFLFQKSLTNFVIFILSVYFVVGISFIQGNYIFSIENINEVLNSFVLLVINRLLLDPAQMLHLVYLKAEGLNFYLMNNTLVNMLFSNFFTEKSPALGYTAIGNIIDGYKIFSNNFGIIIASLWFAMLLKISVNLIQSISEIKVKNTLSVVLFFSMISFYYSNIFSIVPNFIIFAIFLFKKVFKF
jgi:hypothetical protein